MAANVVARANLPPLASVDDVSLLYGPLDDADIARVQRLCEMASAAVRRFCRQTLSFVADDEVLIMSSGTTVLVLAERPVVDVASVEVQLSPPQDAGEVVTPRAGWASTGRFVWDSSGRLQRFDGLTWGLRYDPVLVVYSHGYDPVPDDVVGLVASKVASFLAGIETNPDGLKSLQTGAMSETYSNAAGTAAALGCSVLTQDERDALLCMGYRQRTISADIGTQ